MLVSMTNESLGHLSSKMIDIPQQKVENFDQMCGLEAWQITTKRRIDRCIGTHPAALHGDVVAAAGCVEAEEGHEAGVAEHLLHLQEAAEEQLEAGQPPPQEPGLQVGADPALGREGDRGHLGGELLQHTEL